MRKSYIYDVETICNTKNEVADAMSKHITLIAYTCEDSMELKKAIGDKAGRKSENFRDFEFISFSSFIYR